MSILSFPLKKQQRRGDEKRDEPTTWGLKKEKLNSKEKKGHEFGASVVKSLL